MFEGKNIMKHLKKFFAVALILIFVCSSAFAKSGDEHIRDWNNSFGITDKPSRDNIQPLWKQARDVIDGYENDYKKLHGKFEWFSLRTGAGEHRLLFHWGFNADPKNYKPLVNKVDSLLENNPDAKKEKTEFFRYLANEIQSERNRNLINSVIRTTGIPTARGYANAIATIIYDIHLLGDYATSYTSALPSIGEIEKDLINHGFKRLLAGGDKSEKLKRIEHELDAAVKVGRGRTNSKRAENLLEAVRIFLPQILNERFKNSLQQKGITITELN